MNTPARATRPLAPDFSEVEDASATPVAEVVVTYAGTMLDVQHVGPAQTRQRVGMFVGLGAAIFVAGLSLFTYEVAQDWDGHRQATIAAFEDGEAQPEQPGLGIGGWAALLGVLGLVPMGIGLARISDRRPSAYTVGEREDASFHAVLDHDGVLPLVANGRLAFTPGMTGEIATTTKNYRLQDLVEDGRARTDGSFYTVPLPADARCRLEYGALTFQINAVAPGRVVAGRDDTDRALWASNALSLFLIGGLLALAQLTVVEGEEMALEDSVAVNRYVGYISQPDLSSQTADDEGASETLAGTVTSERAALEEGRMGDPLAKTSNQRVQIQRRTVAPVGLPRVFDPIASAQKAGILGQIESNAGHFLAQAPSAFTSGADDEDVWAGLQGDQYTTAFGDIGTALVGNGRGGGGTGEGTIGLGSVGLSGTCSNCSGSTSGVGYGGRGSASLRYDHGGGDRIGGRDRRVPTIRVAKAVTVCGGAGCLDKDVIRRVVRSHINEVRHCYNQGLVRDPNLDGRVSVQFRIDGVGSVKSSIVGASSLGDPTVERCIASAVKRWRFPAAPGRMGSVIVTYPFVLAPG